MESLMWRQKQWTMSQGAIASSARRAASRRALSARSLMVWALVWFLGGLSAAPLLAQVQKQSEAEKSLIQKAQALELRGRPDIAVQVWQQILLSDPNNQLA